MPEAVVMDGAAIVVGCPFTRKYFGAIGPQVERPGRGAVVQGRIDLAHDDDGLVVERGGRVGVGLAARRRAGRPARRGGPSPTWYCEPGISPASYR